jgi:hypothetical protein
MSVVAAVVALVSALPGAAAQAEPGTSYPDHQFRLRRYHLEVRIDYAAERVEGVARLTLVNASSTAASEIPLLTYRLMPVESVSDARGRPIPTTQRVVAVEDEPKRQVNFARVLLPEPAAPGDSLTIHVRYGGYLLGYAETDSRYVRDRIDPQFTFLRDDGLGFPMLEYPSKVVNRKVESPAFDYVAVITVPDSLWVANGGRLRERRTAEGLATFVYENVKPAWRMDFAIAKYRTLRRGELSVVFFPQDSVGAERVLTAAGRSLELYTDWFGPLPGGRQFTVIEVPDGYGSQADVSSITQTASAFRHPDARRQLYHEISHFWDVPPGEPLSPRLNEGLATYLEYYTADVLDSLKILDARLEVVREWLAQIARQREDLRTHPLKDYGRVHMTDFSYSTGVLFFAGLRELLGTEGFRAVIRECHTRHGERGGTLEDFVGVIRTVAPTSLARFLEDWIYTTGWVDAVVETGSMRELMDRYR